MKSRNGVVIVLYNPDILILKKNLSTINENKNVNSIIIVDNSNSSSKENLESVKSSKLEYIHLKENKGIAYAQNTGVKRCKNKNVDNIFFFDQDSQISQEYINKMLLTMHKIEFEDTKIGILSPKYVEYEENSYNNKLSEYSKVMETISSGSLIKIDVLNKVGSMEEFLFIDYVDFEFCWRVSSMGYSIYTSNQILLKHKVGEKVIKILGKKIYVPQPFRYYYIYRNGKILLKREYVPKKWKNREKILRIITPLIIILLLDKKKERLHYMMKGVRDGYKY